MARTKASVGAKVAAGKSSKARCCVTPSTSSGGGSGSNDRAARSNVGGNPVCPRETPKWQRPITNFFNKPHDESTDDNSEPSTNKLEQRKSKRNVIESDDENDDHTKNNNAEQKNNKETTTDNPDTTNNNPKSTDENKKTENDNEQAEKPINNVLDETFELNPLNDESSHKIEEYYPKDGVKGKGVGKKSTKNKENDSGNRRDSLKRDSEDVKSVDDPIQANKRVKVN